MGALQLQQTNESALHYAAFISYAHSDEVKAARLHRMLERYRPPKELNDSRHLLRPVFRDKDELTASHSLTDKIKDAVQRSRKLIVLCSPAAKASKWVNAEIHLFRQHHGEDAILCAIIEGTPETSFPPALTEGGREPLAADLTEKGEAFRHGMLQLAASMVDVGLDDLVRRETRRRRRMGSAVVLGALAFSGVMAASTLSAVKARELAENNRAQAEDLVEYMITDLKTKLEPVGRLDILDGVGDKVMDYYSGQDLSDMPDDRIARQAKAMHLLGQVALDAGNYEDAKRDIDAAYALTKEILERNPDDTDAIFAHAQSAFWVGKVFRDQRLYDDVRPYWQEYSDLSYRLYETDSSNFNWIMEAAWGENSLGYAYRVRGNTEQAFQHYKNSDSLFDEALAIRPGNKLVLTEKADVITGAEQLANSAGKYESALSLARESIRTLEEVLLSEPKNLTIRSQIAEAKSDLIWQYGSLLNSDEREKVIFEVLFEFMFLTQHDESNDKWKNMCVWHLFYGFEYSLKTTTRDKIFVALDSFESLDNDNKLTSTQKFILMTLKARQDWAMGRQKQALSRVEQLAALDIQDKSFSASYNFIITNLYSDFGKNKAAQKFAKRYLQAISTEKETKRVEALLRQASMETVLGNCQRARELITPILEMNTDHAPQVRKIIACKA